MKVLSTFVLLLTVTLGLYLCHDQIIAHFSFVPEKITQSPIKLDKNVSDVFIETSDGVKIHSLFFKHNASKKVVLFFHGNAGNLYQRYENALALNKKGINILLVDYRGYGRSTGEATEAGIYLDGEAAYHYLTITKSFKSTDITILGRSIGSTVAMEISQNKSLGGIVLISPLSTGKEMAKLMGFGSLSWFAKSAFDNVSKAKNIIAPVLIIHGDNDDITPLLFGQQLYAALPGKNKQFIQIKDGDHNALIEFVGPKFWDWVYMFINYPELHY